MERGGPGIRGGRWGASGRKRIAMTWSGRVGRGAAGRAALKLNEPWLLAALEACR